MKEKLMTLNSTVDLWPWKHFIQDYLTQFGGLLKIQCSALVFYYNVKLTTEELIMAQFA